MPLRERVQRLARDELLSNLSLEAALRDRCLVMTPILRKPSRGSKLQLDFVHP